MTRLTAARPAPSRVVVRSRGSGAPRARFWPAALLVLVAGSVLLAHARRYLPFLADDALISLRYSERLLQGDGLTWNDGERVEGYSNLLWVLATALVGVVLDDLVLAARALGVVSAWACLAAVVVYRAPFASAREWIAPAAGALLLALSGALTVWSIGGLEQPLLAALLAWAYVMALRVAAPPAGDGAAASSATSAIAPLAGFRWQRWWLPGLALGLLSWTRPDGFLFAVPLALCVTVLPGAAERGLRPALLLLAIPALFVGLQLAFRLAYYGEWAPNTALVKLAWTPQRQAQGIRYVLAGLSVAWPLLVLAATSVAALFEAGPRFRTITLSLALICWLAYVATIGGDIFPAWRHLVAAHVLLALLSVEGISALARRFRRVCPVLVGGLLLLPAMAVSQSRDPGAHAALRERWEWDAPPIAELLRRHFGARQPLLAVDAAGCLPFFSKLPALDMLGLNDAYLTHHPPKTLGQGPLGHELGDGRYFLERRPDLVIFGLPSDHGNPKFRGGWEMFRDPQFARDYERITFAAGRPERRYRVWLRRTSDKVGERRSGSEVVLPGHLFAKGDNAVAREMEGELVTALVPKAMGRLRVSIPEGGVWRVEALGLGGDVRITAHAAGRRSRGNGQLELRVPRPTKVILEVTPAGEGTVGLRQVTLSKIKP